MKKQIAFRLAIFLFCLFAIYGLKLISDQNMDQLFRPYGERGEIYQSKEISNGELKVKIDARHETGVYLEGSYHIFSSLSPATGNWREITWSKRDDPVPVNEKQFHFINNRSGFLVNDQVFAVTIDAGETWSVWKPTEQLKFWTDSYQSIREVKIEPDGKGVMTLFPFSEDHRAPQFHTKDYGQNWTLIKN